MRRLLSLPRQSYTTTPTSVGEQKNVFPAIVIAPSHIIAQTGIYDSLGVTHSKQVSYSMTTKPASKSERPKATKVGERLIADIFFISSEALDVNDIYLLIVDEFSGMIHTRRLEGRHKEEIVDAFESIIADYGKHNHTVGAIRLDNEGSFAEMSTLFSGDTGIRLEPGAPERHARVAERAIRTICGLFRTTLAGLPFVLVPHLYYRLIEYVVTSNNLMTNSHNSIPSAHEFFHGKVS